MIDYEVMKTETGYCIQVNGKWYSVDDKQRHMPAAKLQKLFTDGVLKLYAPEAKEAIKK